MSSFRESKLLAHVFAGEEGSVSVLISALFIVVFILSIGIIDISDSYLAKRELTQLGEDALLVASHSLDESRYYSGIGLAPGQQGAQVRVPIDCQVALRKFHSEITSHYLRKNNVEVSGWRCIDDQITASISSSIQAIVTFPIISAINGGKIAVSATIGATSELSS